jgi:hypothetical protein
MPFMEQGVAFNAINFLFSHVGAPNTTVVTMSVSSFTCPSDINKDQRTPFPPFTGLNATASVTSYGVNAGDWFVWNGFNAPDARNAFLVNKSRRIADFVDGTSNTLLAADVKVYNPLCGPFSPLPPGMTAWARLPALRCSAPTSSPCTSILERAGARKLAGDRPAHAWLAKTALRFHETVPPQTVGCHDH